MTEPPRYPRGLVWRPDGHVSDWVLSALVDGQDELLQEDAVAHADTCEDCATRLGLMASAAFSVGQDLRAWAREQVTVAPFPARAFTVVALLIALGASGFVAARGPAWLELPHKLMNVWRWGRALAPFAGEHLDGLAVVLGWLGVFSLVAAGLVIAKLASLASEQESSS